MLRNPRKRRVSKPLGAEGFEPSKAEPPDLQSGPFDHFGTLPKLTQRARCPGPCSSVEYRTGGLRLARNSLGVSQVQLKVGGVGGEAVELDVAGGVGGEGWAGGPEGGAFDGDAVFVEEGDAIVDVEIAVDRRADGNGDVEQAVLAFRSWRGDGSFVGEVGVGEIDLMARVWISAAGDWRADGAANRQENQPDKSEFHGASFLAGGADQVVVMPSISFRARKRVYLLV